MSTAETCYGPDITNQSMFNENCFATLSGKDDWI